MPYKPYPGEGTNGATQPDLVCKIRRVRVLRDQKKNYGTRYKKWEESVCEFRGMISEQAGRRRVERRVTKGPGARREKQNVRATAAFNGENSKDKGQTTRIQNRSKNLRFSWGGGCGGGKEQAAAVVYKKKAPDLEASKIKVSRWAKDKQSFR